MNHPGQTGLVYGPCQFGLAGTHPVHILDPVGPRQTGLAGAHPVWSRADRYGPYELSFRLNDCCKVDLDVEK